jgi:hypothetical protein
MAQRKAAISRDRRCGDGGLLAIGDEPSVRGTQPHLRLPGDGPYSQGQTLEPILQGLADPSRMSGAILAGSSSLCVPAPGRFEP